MTVLNDLISKRYHLIPIKFCRATMMNAIEAAVIKTNELSN